jgi:AraC family transcriptional activator of tynA and feaB
MVAHSLRPFKFEHGLTSSFLAMLMTNKDTISAITQNVLRDQTLDLVALSISKTMENGSPRISSGRALVLFHIRAAVEAGLYDPALNAKAVAQTAGVSVRYANTLLAQEDTSIGRLIRARRLARCRKAFEDPLQASRTVSEIAYGWGYSDMTHFGRSFKKAFGVSPTEYRRLVKQQTIS